jgi:hypothetical protein
MTRQTIALDANGLPQRHEDGRYAAARAYKQWVAEQVGPVYFVSLDEAYDIVDFVLARYLAQLTPTQLCAYCARQVETDPDAEADAKVICGWCAAQREDARRDAAREKQWEEETGR